MTWLRRGLPAFVFLLAGCTGPLAALPPVGPPPAAPGVPVVTVPIVRVLPLPGSLDDVPLFNSNSPELLETGGVLLTTLPPAAAPGHGLDFAFKDRFAVFSHHVAASKAGAPGEVFVALIAHNQGTRDVAVDMAGGATALTRPDAPFLELAGHLPDPEGKIFAGPGDRVATDLVHGRLTVPAARLVVPAGGAAAIAAWPLPTQVNGTPGRNARSTLLEGRTDGPLALSEVAIFTATPNAPPLSAFLALLAAGTGAGPRDGTATPYDPAKPPTGGAFRYGRVAGVSTGARWTGRIALDEANGPGLGQRVALPIATVVLNRLGTAPIQAALMQVRVPDSAYQAHGNYGVRYEVAIALANPDAAPRRYTFGLSSPAKMNEGQTAVPAFQPPAGRRVFFRGPVRLAYQGGVHDHHLVLRESEDGPVLETVTVAPGETVEVKATLIYPADCTPPQILAVGRV